MNPNVNISLEIDPTYTEHDPVDALRAQTYPEGPQRDAFIKYRKDWHQFPKKLYLQGSPLHLDIEATTYCNLKCPYCPRTIREANDSKIATQNFPMDVYERLLEEGVANGLRSIKYNYLGEPLMNRQLPKMVKMAKEAGIVDTMINTNATNLTPRVQAELLDAGLDLIIYSLDSHIKELFEKSRVGASFDQVVNNVRSFWKLRNETGKRPFIRINAIQIKEVIPHWEDYVDFWGPYADSITKIEYKQKDDGEAQNAFIHEEKEFIDNFICAQLYQRAFIRTPKADGTIPMHPCCGDSKDQHRIGDLASQGLKEIWLGSEMMQLRQWHINGEYLDMGACHTCGLCTKTKQVEKKPPRLVVVGS